MAKFFVRYGMQIPDGIDMLFSDSLIHHNPNKWPIKNLLPSIKELEHLQSDYVILHKNNRQEE